MAKLYSNENFPLPVVQELRRLGHDILTIQDTGKAGQFVEDDLVLVYAVADDRAVLTLNRKHFIRLHAEKPDHHGIIVCTVDGDSAGQAGRIHAAVDAASDLRGKLIRVNRPAR